MDLIIKELKTKINKKLNNLSASKGKDEFKDLINNHLNSPAFLYNIEEIIKYNNFKPSKILNLCLPLMNDLCNNAPQNWLIYLYNYTLNKNFKSALTMEIEDDLEFPCQIYFKIFKIFNEYEKTITDSICWQSKYPLTLLNEHEINSLERKDEYTKFSRGFNKDLVYEMMKLNGELFNFNTLDHICGVHHLAMYIARQLYSLNVPIDLGRVSGAATGHDIGKYGCKGEELNRVPHLHYYYTDQWFKKHNITYIRNVASNHSVWDLELENLSLESLILIYCDFRVKNISSNNIDIMHIFSLKESFDVILEKLENVDSKKKIRYKKVYEKLRDFEGYLHSIGVSTNLDDKNTASVPICNTNYALLQGNEVTDTIKNLAIKHNINLMYLLRDEFSLNTILDQGRSEINSKEIRQYIQVLDEYSTYFTQTQKIQTINFLYENLTHEEDDVRRHCALLIGRLIAIFDREYSKELPKGVIVEEPLMNSHKLFKQYLNLMLFPSNKLMPTHRKWLGYNTKVMVKAVFSNTKKEKHENYRNDLLSFYESPSLNTGETLLYLLSTCKYISLDENDNATEVLLNFILSLVNKKNIDIRLAALDCLCHISLNIKRKYYLDTIINNLKTLKIKSKIPSENLLYFKLFSILKVNDLLSVYRKYCEEDFKKVPDLFLSNLKSATSWIIKKQQIEILLNYTLNVAPNNGLHTCIHFCNLLKVSEYETVRNKSGYSILEIMPILNISERNEVAIELLRSLELEGQKFTQYIPSFLGKVILWLKPDELDEIIEDLKYKIKISKENVKVLILKTIGVTLENYSEYKSRFTELDIKYETRLKEMLSILLNGIGNYNSTVKEAAIITLGKNILGSRKLDLQNKLQIFKLTCKKLLTLIGDDENDRLLLLTNAATLNHIYRFISNYTLHNGEIDMEVPKKIAFFPGTFDPFSLGHKHIAKTIRDLGFEVYLAVDEFSWSKKTLPNLLRRTLINLSICDEFNIYIYPEIFQVNIANPEDLKNLKNVFKTSIIYFVSGSDVLLNASCYKKLPSPNSIHQFPHIIFERGNSKKIKEAKKLINNSVEILNLPPSYTLISSTQIRNYIDKNRDVSALVDPLVSQYILENGFYKREPLDKISTSSNNLEINFYEEITDDLIKFITSNITDSKIIDILLELRAKESPKVCIISDGKTEEIISMSFMHWIRNNNLYSELKDEVISSNLRIHSVGRIMMIDGFYINYKKNLNNTENIIITETLAYAISRDYEFGIYKPYGQIFCNEELVNSLESMGFRKINNTIDDLPVLSVNMSNPSIVNLDLENIIKEPFRSNHKVKSVINSTRKQLIESLQNLYPDDLLLSFDSQILHQKLINNICKENNVPIEILSSKSYGDLMCVPYGDILDRYVVPNTVTKSLHTEKYYNEDISSFFIGESPYYLSLKNQIKMIKSFNRPIILVDNILHKGYRMRALDPLLTKENINVNKIVCGILSGRGKDLMDIQNRNVSSVYFIPKLKVWFNENNLYPFLGGDGIWRGDFPKRNLIPSINTILPYTYPVFIKDASHQAVYNLSNTCLNNSLEILMVLEKEYHNLYGRNLTLHSLGDVITIPRCPDIGNNIDYNLYSNPSSLIKKDLELLKRLKNIL